MTGSDEPVDAVFTWVDDSFPGYVETLNRYVADPRDTDPNRMRDNLQLLKFALRSLAVNAPFLRRIYLFTCRPQVPEWLHAAHPRIRVVHHDAVVEPSLLPLFNSFAIVSHLHLLPGLSRRFLYFEDDMLVPRPLSLADYEDGEGRPLVFTRPAWTRSRASLDGRTASPWNLAMATADERLDRHFGKRRRRHTIHGPRLIDRELFAAMVERFAPEIEATRRSRFRAGDNVPPEYLYPHFLAESGIGVHASAEQNRRMEGYASLDNVLPWTWWQLASTWRRQPATITLNDNFGKVPNPRVVAHVRRTLEGWFPDPSPFERQPKTSS